MQIFNENNCVESLILSLLPDGSAFYHKNKHANNECDDRKRVALKFTLRIVCDHIV